MERILDFNKFKCLLEECNQINKEEVNVRKIIEICSKDDISVEEFDYILREDLKYFEMVKNILSQELSQMKVVKDMIVGEYCSLNLASIYPDDSEDEVYL